MTSFALLAAAGCQQPSAAETAADTAAAEYKATETTSPADTLAPAEEPLPDPEPAVQPAAKPAAQAKPAVRSGKETLYISTYGANGKVWGHVTLNGKTGHGTIHDEDENSYSITVTRHGGELYGTDQNGRQYVFRM